MIHTQLFLGFPIQRHYQEKLDQLSSTQRELFIQDDFSLYLQQIQSENVTYLGKFLGPLIEVSSLDFLQSHIYSLLKKLVPDFPYEHHPLLLLSIPLEE